ncbi:2TM domain-containing protein [Sneathiella limimaris]|uniref:2TM domain-containing protein n=1 Tax=Sneathiella limimaris TaxID=1964213 RepID=UPI00146D5162|nr:2TM domain-containing protein [Sneathiella limimaris]
METSEKDLRAARRKVRHIRHFYRHLATYAVVIVFLHIINLLTSSYYWAIWPTLGWGLAVAAQAIHVFGFFNFFDEEWEEREVQKILEKKRLKAQGS